MNTHTTEQLLMCEKADLVKYIEELKKWSLSKDMIESTSAETIEEFEKDVRDNWTELEELQKQDGWPLEELAEELKYSKWFLSETLATAVASRLSAWLPEELMEGVDFAEDADMSKLDGDTLVKMIDSYTKNCIEKEQAKNYFSLKQEIEKLKKEISHKNKKFEEWIIENKELTEKIEEQAEEYSKLREEIDELKKCNTYYRCYLCYADPKGYAEPDKEHIDKFAGDDEELKKSLYEDFDIEDEETDEETDDENAAYLDGKKIVDTGCEVHGHN